VKRFRIAAVCASAVIAIGSAIAQTAGSASVGPEAGTTVFTRARVASSYQDAGKSYVRLKLPPRWKIPFTTQTFRVTDLSLLADIPEGAWVKFTSRYVDGENVLTAIHAVPACVRFQPCE
jgi:Cu/Ag efflux protein CusF